MGHLAVQLHSKFRQNQILHPLKDASSREALQQVLSNRSPESRTAIAHRVC